MELRLATKSAGALVSQKIKALDATDKRILRILEEHPQASNRQIATEIGVQEATVARRIGDLTAGGRMKVTAQLNVRTMGFDSVGYVDIWAEPSFTREIIENLKHFPEVFAVEVFVDAPQIIAMLLGPKPLDLFHFARLQIGSMRGVARMRVAESVRTLKFRTQVSILRPHDEP
jgi:DNA-binding Lrp family transcriptional regulator